VPPARYESKISVQVGADPLPLLPPLLPPPLLLDPPLLDPLLLDPPLLDPLLLDPPLFDPLLLDPPLFDPLLVDPPPLDPLLLDPPPLDPLPLDPLLLPLPEELASALPTLEPVPPGTVPFGVAGLVLVPSPPGPPDGSLAELHPSRNTRPIDQWA
jgi:hypothetical protein